MKQIVIFSGTTEGRILSDALAQRGIKHIVCVATDYGEEVMEADTHREIRVGRMDREEMRAFLAAEAERVYDATHPYATEVTANIRAAAEEAGIPCVRVRREDRGREVAADEAEQGRRSDVKAENGRIAEPEENGSGTCGFRRMPDVVSCADYLRQTEGKILLTTGSKELAVFAADPALRERLVARVLPGEESIRLCREAGLSGRQIVAAQGPFSAEFNRAIIRDFGIRILVTKESGTAGGYAEKRDAARAEGAELVAIARPEEAGVSVADVLARIDCAENCDVVRQIDGTDTADALRQMDDADVPDDPRKTDVRDAAVWEEEKRGADMTIDLVGAGPGDPSLLTGAAREAVEAAEIRFGAARVLAPYTTEGRSASEQDCASDKRAEEGQDRASEARAVIGYRAEDILPVLLDRRPSRAAVLFSGDVSFYSGARNILPKLREGLSAHGIRPEIRLHPGISSVAYLAAKCCVPYSDAAVCSLHGAGGEKGKVEEVMQKIKSCAHAFVLLSGSADVRLLGGALIENEMEDCEVTLAERLSYPEETIRVLTSAACCEVQEEGLYLALISQRTALPSQGAAPAHS